MHGQQTMNCDVVLKVERVLRGNVIRLRKSHRSKRVQGVGAELSTQPRAQNVLDNTVIRNMIPLPTPVGPDLC